ncbi:MAG: hypothetical protein OXB88_00920 [Bacteriovoracales bacterium]|nr:hypothetical protein [Bacteriovoracales bacterium]
MNFNMRHKSEERAALFLIAALVLSRLIPHPPNFTPVLSMALFCGSFFESRFKSLAVFVLGLILSNIILGLEPISWVVVFILIPITLLGRHLKSGSTKKGRGWAATSIASACFFFVLSNFFVWIQGELYPPTFRGLLECYVMAIPFFGNTLLSTLIYSLVLFEGQGLILRWSLKRHGEH